MWPPEVPPEAIRQVLSTGQPPNHQPRHRRMDERFASRAQMLVILRHAPVVRDPSEGALRNPASRQVLEAGSERQPTEVHLVPLLEPLPRPREQHLLRRRLRGSIHNLYL